MNKHIRLLEEDLEEHKRIALMKHVYNVLLYRFQLFALRFSMKVLLVSVFTLSAAVKLFIRCTSAHKVTFTLNTGFLWEHHFLNLFLR